MIKGWERGDHEPSDFYRSLWALVYDIPERVLFAELPPSPPALLGQGNAQGPSRALASAEVTGDSPPEPVALSRAEWLRLRRFLSSHRHVLTQLASQLYPGDIRLGDTGILMPPGWRMPQPVDLADVALHWQRNAPRPTITGNEREARPMRPLYTRTRDYTRYHRAMRDLARPRLFENRLTYRLLDVGLPDAGHGAVSAGPRLTLGVPGKS